MDLYDEETLQQEMEHIPDELQEVALNNFTYCGYHHDLARLAVSINPRPSIISEAELRGLIESTLVHDPENHDFDAMYETFLDSLAGAPLKWEQRSHNFIVGSELPWRLNDKSPFLWRSESGYQICIPAQGTRKDFATSHPWRVNDQTLGSIEAYATEAAFLDESRRCASVTRALVQMMRLAGCWEGSKSIFHKTESYEMEILRSALSTYYYPPEGKDRTERRLANGLHLWCMAEQQSRPGLRLSLAVSSIEAMLGEHGEGIGRVLGERVAVLLYVQPDSRNIMAEFVRKELYASRSKVLHGRILEQAIDDKRVEQSLRLAALVYRAYWQHRDFMNRIPEDESPEDFFRKLEQMKWIGKSILETPDENLTKAASDLCAAINDGSY